jgi:hypothetical protein
MLGIPEDDPVAPLVGTITTESRVRKRQELFTGETKPPLPANLREIILLSDWVTKRQGNIITKQGNSF